MLHLGILFSACFARIHKTDYSRMLKIAVQNMVGKYPHEQNTTLQLHPRNWWTRAPITPTYLLTHCCDRRAHPTDNYPNKLSTAKAQSTTRLHSLVPVDFNPMNACRIGEATNPGPMVVIVDKPIDTVWIEWLDGSPQQELTPSWSDGKATTRWRCGHIPGSARPQGPKQTMWHLALNQLMVKYKLQLKPVSSERIQQFVQIFRHKEDKEAIEKAAKINCHEKHKPS